MYVANCMLAKEHAYGLGHLNKFFLRNLFIVSHWADVLFVRLSSARTVAFSVTWFRPMATEAHIVASDLEMGYVEHAIATFMIDGIFIEKIARPF